MKETGLLMTPENYGKIEAGTKWMTRRIVKPQPDSSGAILWAREMVEKPGTWLYNGQTFKCPFGTVGDQLYVKEAYRFGANWDEFKPSDVPKGCDLTYERDHADGFWGKLRSPMFMPKWAARLWLEITEVRVEQLGAITEDDAKAEGCEVSDDLTGCADDLNGSCVAAFKILWESNKIHKPGSWDLNPWVWVLSFSKVKA